MEDRKREKFKTMTDRKKLLEVARKSPANLPTLLESCFKAGEDLSDQFLVPVFLELFRGSAPPTALPILTEIARIVSANMGIQTSYNILSRLEVVLGFRRPSLAIYDYAFDLVGGAQKYGCTIAQALQDNFDITLIANREVSLEELQTWYDLDLSGCRLEIVKIPYFEESELQSPLIEPGKVDQRKDNPFHVISRESGHYDFFINNCMLEMVYPLSNISIFICHFPERERSRFFYVDKYKQIICNSRYTAEWIEKKWNLVPHKHIYPPVDADSEQGLGEREKIILSVARFDVGGTKQQLEMAKVFRKMSYKFPEKMKKGWKLMLAGGSPSQNPYLEKIERFQSLAPELEIELKINLNARDLRSVYQKAKIFWHFAGLDQSDPARFEHFGMTTAEAMLSGCVPIVFKGGGQTEIIEDQVSGFFFLSEEELINRTIELIDHPDLVARISQNASQAAKKFNKENFMIEIKKHFNQLLKDYSTLAEDKNTEDS